MTWWKPQTWGARDETIAKLEAKIAGLEALSYEGGKTDRRMAGWLASSASQNSLTYSYGPRLRARSRQAARDFPHMAKAARTLPANLVGTGIRPQCKTGDVGLDAFAEELFDRWAARCDSSGRLGFYGLQFAAARGMVESGESLLRRRPRLSTDGLDIPLQIQLLEADLLDPDRNEVRTARSDGRSVVTGRVVQGVEFDAKDRIVGYWLHSAHPGDSWAMGSAADLTSHFVPASDVAHLYEQIRPGQVRGVPWSHAVLQSVWDLDGYRDARPMGARLAACHTATVSGGDPAASPLGADGVNVEDAGDGTVKEAFAPGLILHAPDGKTVTYHTPPMAQDEGFTLSEQHSIAAGLHMPFALLTGDLSRVNFSSSRFGLMEFRRVMRPLQNNVFVPLFCQPVWEWFVATAIAVGALPDRAAGYPVRWIPPLFEEVDREKDASADLLEMRAGTVSRQEIIRAKGRDPEQVLAEQIADAEQADAAGLTWDSDPRHVSRAGVTQARPAGSVVPGAESEDAALRVVQSRPAR